MVSEGESIKRNMKDQLIQQIVSVVNDGGYSFIILGWNGKLYEAIQYDTGKWGVHELEELNKEIKDKLPF